MAAFLSCPSVHFCTFLQICKFPSTLYASVRIPFRYKNINFNFTNIGTVMGAAVDVFGGALLNRERQNLVVLIKTLIQSEVESLICQSGILLQGDIQHSHWSKANF